MTNEQMIFNAAIKSGIFTAAEATAILSTGPPASAPHLRRVEAPGLPGAGRGAGGVGA